MILYKDKLNGLQFQTNSLGHVIKDTLKNGGSKIYNNQNNLIVDTSKNKFEITYDDYVFIVDAINKKYIDIPIKYYPNSELETHLEYHTGAYNYLYSKNVYHTLRAYINLSDAVFTLSNNDTNYNGYVLFNHKVIDQIDVGLCIRYVDNEVVVQPFYYYMGGVKPKLFYLDSIVLSKFSQISHNEYKGIHNYCIELKSTSDGWYFKITVLNTKVSYEKHVFIKDGMHDSLIGRFLVGASLVPINDNLWDPLCGASFKNVTFDKVLLDNTTYLYPSNESMLKGYSQGYPFANMKTKGHSFIFETIYTLKKG